MNEWWRARSGTLVAICCGVGIPGLLVAALALGRIDLWQVLTVALPAVLAWSLTGRDDSRERYAVRPVRYADALLVAGATVLSAGALAAALFAWGGTGRLTFGAFLVWQLPFSAGVAALAMRWVSPGAAAAVAAFVSVGLWLTRYLFGPTAALIHQESPVGLAVGVSGLVFLAGLVNLAVPRSR